MTTEANIAPAHLSEHDCPYREKVAKYRKYMGYGAMQATYLDDFVMSLHANGECPPTHGNGPTKAWEETLEYTRY